MEANNEYTTSRGIQCLEVLISKRSLEKSDNLFWTLSVYSLENQPVHSARFLRNSEVFHFMAFDWERTLKALLEKHQVSYSIIQKFSTATLYATSSSAQEADYLKAAQELEDAVAFSGQDQVDQNSATVDALV